MTEEVAKVYIDEEGNLQFNDYYLEETTGTINPAPINGSTSEEPLAKILEKLVELQQNKNSKSLSKIAEQFMVDKFTNKNSNAFQWITEFEKECEGLEITQDDKKIMILKQLLEKQCIDWYQSMIIKYSVEAEWEKWKKIVLKLLQIKVGVQLDMLCHSSIKQVFGWIMPQKKESLLLEIRKEIDTGTLIDLIAAGLPNFVADMIDREILKTEKKPCSICEKKSKGRRHHLESSCWFRTNNNKIKNVNNSVLELDLNSQDPKNSRYY